MNGGYRRHWAVGDGEYGEQDMVNHSAEVQPTGRSVAEEVCFGQRESSEHWGVRRHLAEEPKVGEEWNPEGLLEPPEQVRREQRVGELTRRHHHWAVGKACGCRFSF